MRRVLRKIAANDPNIGKQKDNSSSLKLLALVGDLCSQHCYYSPTNLFVWLHSGDISTMADGSVVQVLQDGHKELIAAAGGKK